MITQTDYHSTMLSLTDEIVSHGWGELKITVETLKGNETIKLVIVCGKSFVFFIDKNIDLKYKDIL